MKTKSMFPILVLMVAAIGMIGCGEMTSSTPATGGPEAAAPDVSNQSRVWDHQFKDFSEIRKTAIITESRVNDLESRVDEIERQPAARQSPVQTRSKRSQGLDNDFATSKSKRPKMTNASYQSGTSNIAVEEGLIQSSAGAQTVLDMPVQSYGSAAQNIGSPAYGAAPSYGSAPAYDAGQAFSGTAYGSATPAYGSAQVTASRACGPPKYGAVRSGGFQEQTQMRTQTRTITEQVPVKVRVPVQMQDIYQDVEETFEVPVQSTVMRTETRQKMVTKMQAETVMVPQTRMVPVQVAESYNVAVPEQVTKMVKKTRIRREKVGSVPVKPTASSAPAPTRAPAPVYASAPAYVPTQAYQAPVAQAPVYQAPVYRSAAPQPVASQCMDCDPVNYGSAPVYASPAPSYGSAPAYGTPCPDCVPTASSSAINTLNTKAAASQGAKRTRRTPFKTATEAVRSAGQNVATGARSKRGSGISTQAEKKCYINGEQVECN